MQCQGVDYPCDRQDAVKYRTNTAYVEEELNYQILCPDCQKISDEYWAERWKEYNEGRL